MIKKLWQGRITVCAVLALAIGFLFIGHSLSQTDSSPPIGKFLSVCISCMVALGYTTVLFDLGFGNLKEDPMIAPSKFAISLGLMTVVGASGYNVVELFLEPLQQGNGPASNYFELLFDFLNGATNDAK